MSTAGYSIGSVSVSLQREQQGTLRPNEQQINITTTPSLTRGRVIFAFAISPGCFVESAPLRVRATTEETRAGLELIPGLGAVSVTVQRYVTPSTSTSPSSLTTSLLLTLHTYSGPIPPVVVLWSTGSSDPSFYPARPRCTPLQCTPITAGFNDSIVVVNVIQQVNTSSSVIPTVTLSLTNISPHIIQPSIFFLN